MGTIIGIVGTILGGIDLIALISLLLYYRVNKKSKEIENDAHGNETMSQVINTLKEQFDRSNEDSKEKQELIDALRAEKFELEKKIAALEFENTKNCFWKCEVKGCANRIPPNGL